jgi:predicted lipoprotein with Yx(FWY)xxD motif
VGIGASSYRIGRHGGDARGHRVGSAVAAAMLLGAVLTACAPGSTNSSASTTLAPETVTLLTAQAPFGTYLTDGSGRTLYMWEADRHGTSTCYDACAVDWPPVTVTGKVTNGPGVDADLIGHSPRKDGTAQVTYGGWPLYYFKPDVRPGDLSGQGNTGYGAVWWVIAPNGEPLPSAPQTSAPQT